MRSRPTIIKSCIQLVGYSDKQNRDKLEDFFNVKVSVQQWI
jgi:hypothetical protein